jgi:hypothetical protein
MLLIHSMLLIFTGSRSTKAAIKCLVDTDLCVLNGGGAVEWWRHGMMADVRSREAAGYL